MSNDTNTMKSESKSSKDTKSNVYYSHAVAKVISDFPSELEGDISDGLIKIKSEGDDSLGLLNYNIISQNPRSYMYNRNNPRDIVECEIITSDDFEFPEDEPEDYKSFGESDETPQETSSQDNEPKNAEPDTPIPEPAVVSTPPSLPPNIENFESLDGEPIEEGYFVTLEGSKIRKVKLWDNYILGVTAKKVSESDDSKLTPVVLWGKAVVKDDGRCVPNGYCYPNSSGIAIPWGAGYRVMERIGENEIVILFR